MKNLEISDRKDKIVHFSTENCQGDVWPATWLHSPS